jgi:hypothetical protein
MQTGGQAADGRTHRQDEVSSRFLQVCERASKMCLLRNYTGVISSTKVLGNELQPILFLSHSILGQFLRWRGNDNYLEC